MSISSTLGRTSLASSPGGGGTLCLWVCIMDIPGGGGFIPPVFIPGGGGFIPTTQQDPHFDLHQPCGCTAAVLCKHETDENGQKQGGTIWKCPIRNARCRFLWRTTDTGFEGPIWRKIEKWPIVYGDNTLKM